MQTAVATVCAPGGADLGTLGLIGDMLLGIARQPEGSPVREISYLKLMGGVGHAMDVPQSWQSGNEYEYSLPGDTSVTTYTRRKFYKGDDVYYVWVNYDIDHEIFVSMMHWHTEVLLGGLVDAQKELLDVSMRAASNYTNVIMVVGYAAIFTLWTQTKEQLTVGTSFWVAIFLCASVLAFIAWEVFGMVMRSVVNIRMARVVADVSEYTQRLREAVAKQQEFGRKMYKPWVVTVSVAAGCGLAAFLIMLVAMMHGAWVQFLASSMQAASPL